MSERKKTTPGTDIRPETRRKVAGRLGEKRHERNLREERREVARRLRGYPVHPAVGGEGGSPLRALAMLSGLLDATGLRQDEPARLYGRLADLIDPTCEEVRDE